MTEFRTLNCSMISHAYSFFTTGGGGGGSGSGRGGGGGKDDDALRIRYCRTAATVGQLAAEVVDKSFYQGFDVAEARTLLGALAARVPEWCTIEGSEVAEKAANDVRVFRIDATVSFSDVRARLAAATTVR